MINNIIFDFDTAIINTEGVELILDQALQRLDPDRAAEQRAVMLQVSAGAFAGEVSIGDALRRLFELTQVTQQDVAAAAAQVLQSLNPRVSEIFSALEAAGKQIFILSTGPEEMVRPVTRALHLNDDHVFTNQLIYDFIGNVIGFNEKNPLFLSVGKIFLVEQLKYDGRLAGTTAVVGRGASDLGMRKSNLAQLFVYFANHQEQDEIRRQADYVVDRFDHLVPLFFSEEEISHATMQSYYQRHGGSLEAQRPAALLLENIHESAALRLAEAGIELRQQKGALAGEELIAAAAEANLLGIRSQSRINAAIVAGLPHLWAIGAFCIGTNQIDLEAAADAGIPVFNAPYSNTRSVAELVAGEIIMLMRRIPEKNAAAHGGQWLKSAVGCTEIRGKRVGIIGYGHIGSQVSVLLENLGMSVWFHDIVDKLPLGNARRSTSLESLLEESDVITLHVPDTPETRGVMNAARIGSMKRGAFLINSSRGRVVDLGALRAALDDGRIAGAAIDVFPQEPDSSQEAFVSPLQGAGNVLLTPHIGGSTQEAQVNIATYVGEKLLRFASNGATTGSINFPEVDLPRVPGTHRILHVHHNVPGVLAKINALFARRNINVAGQLLQTRGHIGYLIVDVNQEVSEQVLDLMGHIAETIKVRKIA